MKVFECVPLCELVSSGEAELKTGPFGTQLKASDYIKSGTPVINVRNIGLGGIKPDKLEYISNETRDRLASHILRSGDIVFGRKGAVERHVFVRKQQDGWFQGSDCLRLRFHGRRVEPLFASYFFLTPEHQRWMMNQCSHGATMASLNQGILERIELPLPPLPIQRRIAGILSAYDDLIENSQRRIKILEEMARRLYREWFVHFRFPGHEDCRLVESPLGEIPEAWEVKTLGDISSYINRGITPKYEETGESLVINQKCVRDQRLSLVPARRQSKTIPPDKQIRFGDLLINSTGVGTLGRVAQVYRVLDNCTVDSHVTIARPSPGVDSDFYGCCLLNRQDDFERLGVGATGQTELGREAISGIEVACPPKSLQSQFGSAVRCSRQAVEVYKDQIQNLRRTRDRLLPRLLSGQIDVEALPEPVLSEP
jgi:type I restriction enzyme S subunit